MPFTSLTLFAAPRVRAAAALMLALAAPPAARAGRPMSVDDAGVVGANSCQLESWVQRQRGGAESWAVPACNVGGNLELALGAARVTDGPAASASVAMHAKTVLKPLEADGWGMALTVGNQFQPGRGVAGDLYATVPLSFSFRDAGLLAHANLGGLREQDAGRRAATWGLGAEIALAPQTALTAESFGRQRGKTFLQLGAKHWLLPERVQLDATCGERLGQRGSERFVSLGLVLFSAPTPP